MRVISLFILTFYTSFLLAFEPENSDSSLYEACRAGDLNLVKQIFSHNPKSFWQDKGGQLPLMVAEEKGHSPVVEFLLSEVDINDVDEKNCRTLLHEACISDSKNLLEKLFKRENLELNPVDENGKTPFYLACESGKLEAVKSLLSRQDIDVNCLDCEDDPSSLEIACMNNHVDVVKILLDHHETARDTMLSYECPIPVRSAEFQKRKNFQKEDEFTYFHLACRFGAADVVKMLLKNKDIYQIDTNKRTERNKHPLFLALESGNIEVFECLLEETNIQEPSHSTKYRSLCEHILFKDRLYFLDHAIILIERKFNEFKGSQISPLIGLIKNNKNRGADGEKMCKMFELFSEKVLNRILHDDNFRITNGDGFLMNHFDDFGINYLFTALADNSDAINILLKDKFKKFNLDVNEEKSALCSLCAKSGDYDVWKSERIINVLASLLKRGANPSHDGVLAAAHSGNLEALELLVNYGADINAPLDFEGSIIYPKAPNAFMSILEKYHANKHKSSDQKLIDTLQWFLLKDASYSNISCNACNLFLEEIRLSLLSDSKATSPY